MVIIEERKIEEKTLEKKKWLYDCFQCWLIGNQWQNSETVG